jgi:hypothetical protein
MFSKVPNFKKISPHTDITIMEGETITEIANALGIDKWAAEKRLRKAGIKQLTREAVYPKGSADAIRNVPGPGRPKKDLKNK